MARNAFRVGLRQGTQDTPLPVSVAGITQELDPSDILEVQDMAAAIARAEQIVAAPRSSHSRLAAGPDIFEALGRPTDDTAGPAVAAPPRQTPVPPPSVPRYVTMPTPLPPAATEDDAYFQPSGRMRSLADITLDGYRPEPTLLLRAASRRRRFSWIFVAALAPLLVLAAIAIFTNADLGSAPDSTARPARTARTATANGKTPLGVTSVSAKAAARAAAPQPAAVSASPPVFDVNSLPSAGPLRTKR